MCQHILDFSEIKYTEPMNSTKISKIPCEHIYNIWATDPDQLVLLDLRDTQKFDLGHIPGAKKILIPELPTILGDLGDRLAILIADENDILLIAKQCQDFANYSFMQDCHRWQQKGFPISGNTQNNLNTYFKSMTKKGDNVNDQIIFHQMFEAESSTYTYLIADKKTKEAAIIDPVLETVDRDIKLIEELGLKLVYVLDTHIHADHITGAAEIRKRLGAKTGVSFDANVSCVDIPLEDGQELLLGDKVIKVIATPGHTDTCLTYAFEGMIFTGDALLIRTCGRTDFQQGSSEKLFSSVRDKLFQLPGETKVYPAHDYRGHTSSTVDAEKKFNTRLNETISLAEFKKIMSELKLANPKKIHEAVPANLACGQIKGARTLNPKINGGVPEISSHDLNQQINQIKKQNVKLIDVRRPEEFNNELGHIPGAQLIPLGPELTSYLESGDRSEEIVFICRSGARSATATLDSIRLGYKFTINLNGGMLDWNENNFPVERL